MAKKSASQYCFKNKKWQPNFKLLSIMYPEKIENTENEYYIRRKYRITIKYINEKGKEKLKTIYFGIKGVDNKIDGNEMRTKRKERTCYFHPYFWENSLLNNKSTLKEAFIDTIEKLKL